MPRDDAPTRDLPLLLATGRVAGQWHLRSKTGLVPSLNKVDPAPYLQMHPDDAETLNPKSSIQNTMQIQRPNFRTMPSNTTTLAILAGGAGTRMGTPKAMLEIDLVPILSWLLSRFNWPGPTLLVTAPATGIPPGARSFDRHAVDAVDGNGPLQGVLTALQHSDTEHVAIVTVDMPNIDAPKLVWLLEQLQARPQLCGIMCRRDSASPMIEPFPAIFKKNATDIVQGRLTAENRSVHGLCDDTSVAALNAPTDWPANTWVNLNHPHELAMFQAERLKSTR